MKFKKGDTVQIITGKEAGSQGEIIQVLPKANKVVILNNSKLLGR